MSGQSKAAGAGNDRMKNNRAQFFVSTAQEQRQRLLDIGVMALIIRKNYALSIGRVIGGLPGNIATISDGDFYSGGTDIDS